MSVITPLQPTVPHHDVGIAHHPSGQALQVGDPVTLGRHRVVARLGSGGMGQVFLADGPLGRVAIKTIHPHLVANPEFRMRFQQEIQTSFRVRSPLTAELVDFDTTGPFPWLATEFVDAPNLQQFVGAAGPYSADAQVRLARDLATALDAFHAAGIVHRDLKPANVMTCEDSIKIIDFGIASVLEAVGLTLTQGALGTAAWMAPERFDGVSSPAADVYAWGALVNFAASGAQLHEAGSLSEMIGKILYAAPQVDYSRMHPRLARLVRRSLDRDPGRRPTSADLLLDLSRPDWELTDKTRREDVTPPVPPTPRPVPPVPAPGRVRAGRPSVAVPSLAGAVLYLASGLLPWVGYDSGSGSYRGFLPFQKVQEFGPSLASLLIVALYLGGVGVAAATGFIRRRVSLAPAAALGGCTVAFAIAQRGFAAHLGYRTNASAVAGLVIALVAVLLMALAARRSRARTEH